MEEIHMYGKTSESQVFVVQKLCKKNRQHQHDRNLNDQIQESITNRLLEYFICKNSFVITENRLRKTHIGTGTSLQGNNKRTDHRIKTHDCDHYSRRCQKAIRQLSVSQPMSYLFSWNSQELPFQKTFSNVKTGTAAVPRALIFWYLVCLNSY